MLTTSTPHTPLGKAPTRRRVVLGGTALIGAALASCAPGAAGGGEGGVKAGGSGKQVTLRLGSRANGNPGDPGTEEFLAAKKLFETR